MSSLRLAFVLNLVLMSGFIASVAFVASVRAETPDEIRNQVEAQMAQRHPTNPAPFWTNLGTEALPVLQQMYGATKSVYEKSWLLDGIGYFSDASAFLQGEISNTDNSLLKSKVIAAYVHSAGSDALDTVEPYLKDKDSNLRLDTAEDLKRYSDDPRVKARLAKFLSDEKVEWVKSRYDQSDKIPLMRRSAGVMQPHGEPLASPTPLPEKLWAGEWKGVFISAKKTSAVTLTLKSLKLESTAESAATASIAAAAAAGVGGVGSTSLSAPKSSPGFDAKWKIELALPKQSKFELQGKDIEMTYFLTKESHWLEIRDKKDERVVVVRRAVKAVATTVSPATLAAPKKETRGKNP
jgi:hypothetical protein